MSETASPSELKDHKRSQIWLDYNTGKHYFIDQQKGTQDYSDKNGNVVRPFDPNLTGKYDYDGRAELQKGLPVNFGGVELPKCLGPSHSRVYSPENFLFEGYTQFPKPVAAPYTNNQKLLATDFVSKRRSREANMALNSLRDSYAAKWNKRLIDSVTNSANFSQNNVGTSFLTAPMNYAKQEEVKGILQVNKDKILSNIEEFKQKYVKQDIQFSHTQSPSGEQQESTNKKKRKISPSEARIDTLAQTFTSNFAGKLKNGRELKEPEYAKIALTQITSPISFSPTRTQNQFSAGKTEFGKTQSEKKESLFQKSRRHNALTLTESSWKQTMQTQDIMTVTNLFQNYGSPHHGHHRESSKDRAHTSMNYETMKKGRISEVTKQAIDPRQSLIGDPATGIVGLIPSYQNLKQTHKSHVKPFFGQSRPSMQTHKNHIK